MISVERYSAFNVNSIGLKRAPFPLSFSLREAEGSWLVGATAAQAGELVDLLAAAANERIVVAALDTNSFLHENHQQWLPSLIAAEQGVDCTVHPLGDGEELLLLDRSSLPTFFDGSWSPYELSLVDAPANLTPEQLDHLALTVATTDLDRPVLPLLDGSTLRFSGHDDCYVSLETTDPALPSAVLVRLLALMAGSALTDGQDSAPVRVPEPDRALAERLIATAPHWAGTLATASTTEVALALSPLPRPWRLTDPRPEHPACTATLDLLTGRWTLTPGVGSRRGRLPTPQPAGEEGRSGLPLT
ncbi:hypothetical protein [Kitasatospora purpeofusca]|uniref:hypothetical protein n=1 Tax=Kitasatospora purpeofusca TaxID=67352 RepID=UPI0036D21BFD